MTRHMRYIGSRFINIGRKFLPLELKNMIKTAIRPAINHIAGESHEQQPQLKENFLEVYEKIFLVAASLVPAKVLI